MNPEFVKTIQVDYYFEQEQWFRAIVSDSDQLDKDFVSLSSANFIGEVIFKAQNLVCSKSKEIEVALWNKDGRSDLKKGVINISYDEVASTTNQELKLTLSPFSGNFINGKEYFMTVMKQKQSNSKEWIPVLRTEKLVFNQSLSPWKMFSIPLDWLINKNSSIVKESEIPLKLWLAQYNTSGHHSIWGYSTVTVGRWVNGETLLELDEPINNSTYTLKICKWELFRTHSFLDYINNGCELNLVVGVDFTGSNMNVITGQNLHSSDFTQNQYYNAIQKIGGILLNFDSDKNVPLFGFGAMIDDRFYKDVSNWFALNGNIFRPEANGIEGIENWYKKNMNNISYSGPTYFAPLLKFWNEMVAFECEKNIKRYYIYLLLTDGTNHDIENTIEQVVKSSKLPVSIIIIGIGDADFSNMEFLDSDDQLLFSEKTTTFLFKR